MLHSLRNIHSDNIKNIWENIRSEVNIKNHINPKITQLNVNGRIIDKPIQIANEVNDFFVNVGPNTEKEVPKVSNNFNFIIAHISNEEVLEIIKCLPNKSTSPACFPLSLLHRAELIAFPLCHIINRSLTKGVFPEKLKIVKVIPIPPTQDVDNFRPISLLSIFDKIIENVILRKLYHFLEHHEILFENQFGFRKNNSTSNALMEITESIDSGNFGCGIFIDLKKAYDTVNHEILLKN